jgi:manganese/zinc/iron transport system permease protein
MIISVIISSVIMCVVSLSCALGCISAYSVIKKISLLGDVISHAAFPGIVLFFLLFHTTDIKILFIGGVISSFISVYISFLIFKKKIIPKDTAFALVLSCFFSFGIILLSLIQKKSFIGQSLLNNFIYGNIFNISYESLIFIAIVSFIVTLFFFMTYNIQRIIAFDKQFAIKTIPYCFVWEILFLTASIIIIVLALQMIGILLMSSLIIIPGTIARITTHSYLKMLIISCIICCFSCLSGVIISLYCQSLPTGPIIILIGNGILFFMLICKKIKKELFL